MAEKILVVEDERNIASFVAMYLKNARYQVDIARDGAEALQKAESLGGTRLMGPRQEPWGGPRGRPRHRPRGAFYRRSRAGVAVGT